MDQMVELKNAMKNLRDLVFCTLAEYQDKAKIQLPEIADNFQDYLLQALRFLACTAPPGIAQIIVLDFDDVAMLAQHTLFSAASLVATVKEWWERDFAALADRLTKITPEWTSQKDNLLDDPMPAAAKQLILNKDYPLLGELTGELDTMLRTCASPVGLEILDPTKVAAWTELHSHSAVTVAVTFVLFHVKHAFSKLTGPAKKSSAAELLKKQLEEKGTWSLLPVSMARSVSSLIQKPS